ncbi:phosphatidylinositol glycan, class T [Rhodotorula toruloides]|uniref:Phosphatidylinositol glycan, class T n=1 Tax=Rhodotorula toruloides TaxID=5286 RepID=A0A511KQZ4_RHOTO|nr:phosphatidylinositol glycan, class T [Rhodotorula toruloides]
MLVRLLVSLLLVSLGCTALANASSSVARADSYRESLRLTPFPDGKVHSEFSFRLEGAWRDEGLALAENVVVHDHTLLPRLLTSLVRQHRVASFHLTLSSGRWRPTWPLHMRTEVPASGIELTAWLERLEGEKNEDERERWEDFTSGVSGLFCAGVVADGVKTSTSSPTWTVPFNGEGDEREYSLYSLTMPRLAAACTESLTPFLSLLPCSYHAGLSSLLNPHRLFDGDFTLIGVNFLLREAEEKAAVELEVESVLDPVRKDRLTGQLGRREFSMRSLYERTLATACPVARDSRIELVVPTHSVNPFSIEPDIAREVTKIDGQEVAVWDTKRALETAALDVRITWPGESVFHNPAPSKLPQAPVAARRLLFGVGQERGRIERVLDLDYTPSVARERPSTLQALVRLPPKSTTRLTLAYQSASLWYTEYPSDSNRGFSVPGATVVLLPPAQDEPISLRRRGVLESRRPVLRLQTPTTLLSLPTPDFSMPYNVIILTSTVMALFFGSVMNGMMRRWWIVDERWVPSELFYLASERVLTLFQAIPQLVRPQPLPVSTASLVLLSLACSLDMTSYNHPPGPAYASAYDPDELDYGEDELVMDVGAEQAPLSGAEVSPELLLGAGEASVAATEVEDLDEGSSREEGEVEEDEHERRSDSETLQAPSQISYYSQSGERNLSRSSSYEAPPRWVSTLAPGLGEGPPLASTTDTSRRRSEDERPVRSPSWEGKKIKSVPYDRSFLQAPSPHPPHPHALYPPQPSSYPPPSYGYYPPHYHYSPYSPTAHSYGATPPPHYPPAYSSPPSHPPYAPLPPPHPQPHVPLHSITSTLDPALAMTAMQVGLTVIGQQQTAAFATQQRMVTMASASAAQQPQREAETMAVPMRMGAMSEKKLTGKQRGRKKQWKKQEEAHMYE